MEAKVFLPSGCQIGVFGHALPAVGSFCLSVCLSITKVLILVPLVFSDVGTCDFVGAGPVESQQ